MKYLVIQKWRYTVQVEVEADSRQEAEDKANDMTGERVYDDCLHDASAREIGEAR
jgi:hypothetical protein